MGTIVGWIAVPFGYVMSWCYSIFNNYGLAIIFFNILARVVLVPINIWTHFNSIKMVKIQPAINRIKVKYFGDNETIAEEQSKMFKEEKYNPFLTLIPLAFQIILLLGVVAVIYRPFTYLLHLNPNDIASIENIARSLHNLAEDSSSVQLFAVQDIQGPLVGSYSSIDPAIIARIQSLDLTFLGIDLTLVPSELISVTLLALIPPFIAGFTSWLLCHCQNRSNVLQSEQGNINKYGLMIVSVALSLYLGFFVPIGIALYWTTSNILSIVQMYIMNACIPPKNYVDYEALEDSRKELAELNEISKKNKVSKEDKKREKQDYKRFFSIANKHVVIYSEKSGFYKYYEDIIDYLLINSNVSIHYVTNDPNDKIFEMSEKENRIKPYYIGMNRLITMFLKMDADMVIMTTPDLEICPLKRSIIRKDVEYIFVPHDGVGMSFGFKEHAFDYYDTIFCATPGIVKEYRATEKYYGTKEKTLVEFGFPLIEKLCEANDKLEKNTSDIKQILIGPSWQEDNLLDSCIDKLIEKLYCREYRIVVRPHPEYVKRYSEKMNKIIERHSDKIGDNLVFETDFSSSRSIYTSDLLITDWSGISLEYAVSTLHPVLFINTKVKCENPNYDKIGLEPQGLMLRRQLGVNINKEDLDNVKNVAEDLLNDSSYRDTLMDIRLHRFFNFGSRGKAGGEYIINQLIKKRSE